MDNLDLRIQKVEQTLDYIVQKNLEFTVFELQKKVGNLFAQVKRGPEDLQVTFNEFQ